MTFDFKTGSTHEKAINYSMGVFTIVCVIISTLLNPLIFYVYTKKSKSIMNFLFKVIAVSDFLTNLFPATFIAYVYLSPTKFDQKSFLNQIPEFFCCTFGCISQVTVTLMAVARMIKIIRPFISIKVKWVMGYLIFYAVYMALGNAGALVIAGVNGEKPYHAKLKVVNKYACFTMNMIHCFVGLVCSLITVAYLWIKMKKTDKESLRLKLRSSNTILLMNIPYVISIVAHFLALHPNLGISLSLVKHYTIPVLTSAFNPCVIVARTNTLRSIRATFGASSEMQSTTQNRTQKSSTHEATSVAAHEMTSVAPQGSHI